MKRIFLVLALMLGLTTVSAQNFAIVNSEQVFKSIDEYNEALEQLDEKAEEMQAEVDEKYKAVENYYNTYMSRRATLSEASQKANEEKILQMEQEAATFQEECFGADGKLIKLRIELIQPIQQKVFATIEEYAKANGFDMILDSAQNATMLYHSTKADHTQAVINLLKTK